jgi:hypothetical protein
MRFILITGTFKSVGGTGGSGGENGGPGTIYDKFEVLLKQFVCRFWFQSQSQDNLKE